MLAEHPWWTWGNAADAISSEKKRKEKPDLDYVYGSSPHLSASGHTQSIQKAKGRKGREEHYAAKGALEGEKEKRRFSRFQERFAHAPYSKFQELEEKRRQRRAAARATRKNARKP